MSSHLTANDYLIYHLKQDTVYDKPTTETMKQRKKNHQEAATNGATEPGPRGLGIVKKEKERGIEWILASSCQVIDSLIPFSISQRRDERHLGTGKTDVIYLTLFQGPGSRSSILQIHNPVAHPATCSSVHNSPVQLVSLPSKK